MSLSDDDPRPKAVQIADTLRKEIGAEIPLGSRLPTRKQLADRFGVAGQTVQNGLEILRAEGLIFSAGNRGVFVSETNGRDGVDIKQMHSELLALADRVTALEERCRQGGL